MRVFDHLVWAVPDLDWGVDEFEREHGVRASAGGRHDGNGTRNALVSLGAGAYLEIFGPDPTQSIAGTEGERLANLDAPTWYQWAVRVDSMADLVGDLDRLDGVGYHAYDLGRTRPDGVRLDWKLLDLTDPVSLGEVPFFIDWLDCPHPSTTSASGLSLVDVVVRAPHGGVLTTLLARLDVDVRVEAADEAAIEIVVDGPRGRRALGGGAN
jgi:hypothetical protein